MEISINSRITVIDMLDIDVIIDGIIRKITIIGPQNIHKEEICMLSAYQEVPTPYKIM